MSAVLDLAPELTVLDETILDADLPCRFGDGGAAWRWTMTCCGTQADLCEHHDQHGIQDSSQRLSQPIAFHVCAACGHPFGFSPLFGDVYSRRPI